ncbi:hypothetical protein EAE99_006068 [Botrytis elliptica]|nr:hypothetical protein EAE99_006068 [Botrytis elliptica]
MSSSQLRGGRDTQCALKPEERDPGFSFPQCHEQPWFPSHQKASCDFVKRPPPKDSASYRSPFVRDTFPSAHEYLVQKQQEQQQEQQQRQVSKPAPPSPTVSLISTYGQTPMGETPNLGGKAHHSGRDRRAARSDLNGRNGRSSNNMQERGIVQHSVPEKQNSVPTRNPIDIQKHYVSKQQDKVIPKHQHHKPQNPKLQYPIPKQHSVPKQDPGEKESGCCSVM